MLKQITTDLGLTGSFLFPGMDQLNSGRGIPAQQGMKRWRLQRLLADWIGDDANSMELYIANADGSELKNLMI